jgi:hypothetical protein
MDSEYVDLINTRRAGNQSLPACPAFRLENTTRDEAGFSIDPHEVEEEILDEQENTSSFVAEVTKWEKIQLAGQKLSESALTAGTVKSYEKLVSFSPPERPSKLI